MYNFKRFLILEVIDPDSCVGASYTSVGVFLAGVITARFGLWVSDLTITQILQVKKCNN